jgi:hypothetical protein
MSRLVLGPIQSSIQWEEGDFSTKVKRQKREADQSPPSTAEIMNGGANLHPPIRILDIVLN